MSLQVEILEQSFEKVKPQAEEFVVRFYENLFTDYPAAKPLFEHTDMAKQRNMLLSSLVFVVENLKDAEALSKALKGLGARHVKYGALPEHYPLVGNSLIKTFSQSLGDDWTSEVQEAWVGAYGAITELMLEGADYSKAEVDLSNAPAPAPAAADEGGLPVAVLEQSFEKVKPRAEEFVVQFYENLFGDYPAAKPLFEHTDMAKQRNMLLNSLVFVVENLQNPEALTKALKGMGARHVKYGALPEHYPLVGNSLIKTFSQFLGSDWTPEVQEAWVGAYGVITELMLEGADYSKAEVQLSPPPSPSTPTLADQYKTFIQKLFGIKK
ncbi:MAG: globin family protein [Prochlorothrix sp.]|nr:globin family protein [Prochlorothrix sp.]